MIDFPILKMLLKLQFQAQTGISFYSDFDQKVSISTKLAVPFLNEYLYFSLIYLNNSCLDQRRFYTTNLLMVWQNLLIYKSIFQENCMQRNAAGWKNETKKQDHLKNKSLNNIFWGQLNLPLFGSQSDLQLSAFERKISARFSCWIYQPPKLIEFCWFKIYLWNQSYNVKIPKPGKVW